MHCNGKLRKAQGWRVYISSLFSKFLLSLPRNRQSNVIQLFNLNRGPVRKKARGGKKNLICNQWSSYDKYFTEYTEYINFSTQKISFFLWWHLFMLKVYTFFDEFIENSPFLFLAHFRRFLFPFLSNVFFLSFIFHLGRIPKLVNIFQIVLPLWIKSSFWHKHARR